MSAFRPRPRDAPLLAPYVPRFALQWPQGDAAPLWQVIEGTLVFVDISGFTALSERLAARGRIGAEQLTDVLNGVFGEMLSLAYARNGMLLKFGGDALLLFFSGEGHPAQAAAASLEMRAALRNANKRRGSFGRVNLRMSVGVHSGEFVVLRVGSEHQDIVFCGPGSTTTVLMEQTAGPNEILVSPDTAAALPPGSRGEVKGAGVLLTGRWLAPEGPGPMAVPQLAYDEVLRWIPEGLRGQLVSGSTESEHRLATIAFLRAEGTDHVLETAGPEALAAQLNVVMSTVQQIARAEAVTILATDIDRDGMKIILASGVPDALEDDGGRALRTVRRIIEAELPLPVRAGVNHGHVFAGDVGTAFRRTYTVMGDTVNLAARLMAAAPPGSLYTTASTLARSRTAFGTVALEPFHVKGKAAPVQAYGVGSEQGRRIQDLPFTLPFVGREAELALLRENAGLAEGGAGRVLAIRGEAGVGKTRLLDEFLASAENTPVLRISGESYGTEVPYRAIRDCLREILGVEDGPLEATVEQLRAGVARRAPTLIGLEPLLGTAIGVPAPETEMTAAMEPQFRRERLNRAVVQLIGGAYPGETFITIEDAQRLDQASLDVIERLAGEAKARPWLMLFLGRGPVEPQSWVDQQIELGPLTTEEARSLVVQSTEGAPMRPHAARDIVNRAAGSPLFLELLLRSAREGRPATQEATLDGVLNAEIDLLPPLPRRFLRSVSVLGQTFVEPLAAEILPEEYAALDRPARNQLARFLVRTKDARVSFRQSLLRDAAYESLPYRRRRELHARAAAALENPGEGDVLPVSQLSIHYSLAGDHVRCWKYARLAAEQARVAYANIEAAAHLERALDAAAHLEGVDVSDVVGLRMQLAEVREAAGLFDQAADALQGAGRLPMRVAERAELWARRARMHERRGRFNAALAAISRGCHLVGEPQGVDEAAARARLLALRAAVRQAQGRTQETLEVARAAAAAAEAVGEREGLARAYMMIDWAYQQLGRLDQAVYTPRALDLLEEVGQLSMVAGGHLNLGVHAYWTGDWDEALVRYRRARELFTRAGDDVGAGIASMNEGELLLGRGEMRAAEAALAEARRIHLASGLLDAAAFAEQCLGRLYSAAGNHDSAIHWLKQAIARFDGVQARASAAEAAVHLAHALNAAGEHEEARATLASQATALAGGPLEVLYTRVHAAILIEAGDLEGARGAVASAIELARGAQLLYDEAELLALQQRLDVARGLPPSEETTARRDELVERLGLARDSRASVDVAPVLVTAR